MCTRECLNLAYRLSWLLNGETAASPSTDSNSRWCQFDLILWFQARHLNIPFGFAICLGMLILA